MNEKEKTLYAEIKIDPAGYGEGKISYENYTSSEDYDPEVEERFFEILREFEALVDVQESDDGCIDGRFTVELYINKDGEFELVVADNSNHERAKVAGGGYMTGLAMRLGTVVHGANIEGDLEETVETLAGNKVFCGAHSAGHVHLDENGVETKTGCGANDEFPLILHNGIAYADKIKGTMEALLNKVGMPFDVTIFDKVIEKWEEVMSDENYFAGSSGATRLQKILNFQAVKSIDAGGRKPVAVTKNLEGAHNEIAIAINFVEGKTVSQGIIADKLAENIATKKGIKAEEVDKKTLPQAFVIDAWRIVELSENVFDKDIASELEALQALYAGVIYQLATAATLTDGSLPIRVYKKEDFDKAA